VRIRIPSPFGPDSDVNLLYLDVEISEQPSACVRLLAPLALEHPVGPTTHGPPSRAWRVLALVAVVAAALVALWRLA
jgi:hypothetical protein